MEVIQCGKRKLAIYHTINAGIIRGNRRGDVTATDGFNVFLLSKFRDERNTIISRFIQNRILSNDAAEIALANAYMIAFLQIGNCGEFSDFVLASLGVKTDLKNRQNRYAFKCCMVGFWFDHASNRKYYFDHAFNMTYNNELKRHCRLSEQPAGIDPKQAIILDAWSNYEIMDLSRFLAGGNPYGADITLANICIQNSVKMNSINKFSPEKVKKIQDWAVSYKKIAELRFFILPDDERERYKTGNGFFDFAIDEHLHDYREKSDPQQPQAATRESGE